MPITAMYLFIYLFIYFLWVGAGAEIMKVSFAIVLVNFVIAQ